MRMKIPGKISKAFDAARKARTSAYAPYSKFSVGAALVLSDGEVVTGANIENASYGGTVCAERVAIWKAVSSGRRDIRDLVVVTDASAPAYPCALCLQIMAEFFEPETRIWVADTKDVRSQHEFSELLLKPFGPKELAAGLKKKKS